MRNTSSMEGRGLLLQEPGFRWLLLGSTRPALCRGP